MTEPSSLTRRIRYETAVRAALAGGDAEAALARLTSPRFLTDYLEILGPAGVYTLLDQYSELAARFPAQDTASLRTFHALVRQHAHQIDRGGHAMFLQLAAASGEDPTLRARAERLLTAGHAGAHWLRRSAAAADRSLQTFVWGPDPVIALTFSRDGGRALVVDAAGNLGIWPLAGNRQVERRGTLDPALTAIAAAPDGLHALTGSQDGVVRAIALHDRRVSFTVQAHTRPITAILPLGDGSDAVSVAVDGTIARWSLRDGGVRSELRTGRTAATIAALLAAGDRLVVATADGHVGVWDLEAGARRATIDAGVGRITALAALPGARELLVSGAAGVVRLDPVAGTSRPQPGALGQPKGDGGVTMAIHPDGSRVFWRQSGRIDQYTLDDGERLPALHAESVGVDGMALSPDGSRLLTWHTDPRTIKLWDTSAERSPVAPDKHANLVLGLALDRRNDRVYTTSLQGGVRVWDASTGAPRPEEGLHGRAQIAIHHDPVGDHLVTVGQDSEVRVYDRDRVQIAQFDLRLYGDPRSAVLADGRHIVTGGGYTVGAGPLLPINEHALTVRALPTGAVVGTLVAHTDEITALVAHPDPARLVSAAYDGQVRLWDAPRGACLSVLTTDCLPRALAVLPDGDHVLVGSQVLSLWSLSQGRRLRSFGEPSDGWIDALACDPHGERALMLSDDRSASVWDLATGTLLARWYGESRFGTGAFCSRDRIVLGDDSGSVLFLEIVHRPRPQDP